MILHPSTISTAPLLSACTKRETDEYGQDVLNVPASLAGLPAISVPLGKGQDGWPLGMQIAGQWGSDRFVLHVAEAMESLVRVQ